MTRKIATGECLVYKTKNGYICQINFDIDPETGQQTRKTFPGKTIHEALEKKDIYIASVRKNGVYIDPLATMSREKWFLTTYGYIPF